MYVHIYNRGCIPRTEYMESMGESIKPFAHLKFLLHPKTSKSMSVKQKINKNESVQASLKEVIYVYIYICIALYASFVFYCNI